MKVTITDIDQRYSLAKGSVTNYIVVELPSGRQIRGLIDDEDAQAVITESSGSKPSEPETQGQLSPMSEDFSLNMEAWDTGPQKTPVGPERQSGWELPDDERHITEDSVEWATLPDTQLPPSMKNILKASGIKPIITQEELTNLKAQILERMRGQPQAGKVDWNSGPRRDIGSRPRKTVPMDEAGNPKPPGGIIEADPGEGPDEDDEGVAQA